MTAAGVLTTSVVDAGPSLPGAGPGDPGPAAWWRRVVAALLDGAIVSGAAWLAGGALAGAPSLLHPVAWPSLLLVGLGEADLRWSWEPWAVAVALVLLALQGWTGATPGKRVAGVAVVRADTLRPAGLGRSLLRVLAHLLDAILLIGYLRPLWDPQRRTFADQLVGTVALRTREPLPHPWFARFRHETTAARATTVSCAALVACLLGVGFSGTLWSEGGSRWTATATCTVEPSPGASLVASADAYVEHTWNIEHRLWVERELVPTTDRTVLAWSWADTDAPGVVTSTDVVVTTTLRAADGTTAWEGETTVRPGDAGQIVDDGSGPPAAVPVPDGVEITLPVDDAGSGWTVTSTVAAVDGSGDATCVLPASALRPVEQ